MNEREFSKKLAELKAKLANAEETQREAIKAEMAELRESFEDETRLMQREATKPSFDGNKYLREQMREALQSGQKREVSLGTLSSQSSTAQSIANDAEAQVVKVMPIRPLAEPKSIYAFLGMTRYDGVATDKIIWPYNTNAVEIVARGEAASATEGAFNWDNFKPSPEEASLKITVDNEALDNASFDLYAYVLEQLQLAEGRYLNKRALSPATFTGLTGPFSGKGASITSIDATWKNIKTKTAIVSSKGEQMGGFCYFGNAMATAILETTPKANGQGGFILENGKIGAYPYYETEYACYNTISGTAKFDSENAYFGFGPFSLLALVGHGVKRLVIDPTTLADKNQTRFILHCKHSLTNLSTVDSESFSVFQIYKLNDVSEIPVGVTVKNTDSNPVKTKEVTA